MNNQTTKRLRPRPLRCVAIAAISVLGAGFLIEVDIATPWPALNPNGFLEWWEFVGTAQAAITFVRMVGIAFAGWGILMGTTGLIASLSPTRLLCGVWSRVTPNTLRSFLAASVVSVALTAPAMASTTPYIPKPQIVLEDLGEVPQVSQAIGKAVPVLQDLGPAEVANTPSTPPAHAISNPPSVVAETPNTTGGTIGESGRHAPPGPINTAVYMVGAGEWTVKAGDNLWDISHASLEENGLEATKQAVWQYLRQVIAVNHDLVGDNPDLIYPGNVLQLPAIESLAA